MTPTTSSPSTPYTFALHEILSLLEELSFIELFQLSEHVHQKLEQEELCYYQADTAIRQ